MIKCSRALLAQLQSNQTRLCTLWLVTLTNGTVYGFTDCDQDIVYNGVTYIANAGYVRSDIQGNADLTVDTSEVDGPMLLPSITEAELAEGLWDYASIQISLVNWADFFVRYPVTFLTQGGGEASATIGNPAIKKIGLTSGDGIAVFGATNAGYNTGSAIAQSVLPTGSNFFYTVPGTTPHPDTSVNTYMQTRMGELILRVGTLGEVTIERNSFKADLQGITQQLTRVIGQLTSPACRTTLGSSLCKVVLVPPTWKALTAYAAIATGDASIGSRVSPVTYSGFTFNCTTPGTSGATEPSWNNTVGVTTNDGSVVWTCQGALTVDGDITGVNPDNRTFYDTSLTQPGPSGGIAITGITQANPGHVALAGNLNLATGSPITITGVVGMTEVNTNTYADNVSGASFDLPISTIGFPAYISGGTVTPLGGTSGFFDNGVVTWLTGLNAGLSMEVQSYTPGQVVLFQPMPNQIQVGDTYTIHAGCDYSFPTCQTRFLNTLNFRGEPFVPGVNKIIQVGKQ